MKKFKFKWLLLSIVLSMASVSQVWGMKIEKDAVIYFDNTASQWDYNYIYFDAADSHGWQMGHIANTNLYVHNRTDDTWSGCSSVRVFGINSDWGNGKVVGGWANLYYWAENITNIDGSYSDFIGHRLCVLTPNKKGSKEDCCRADITFTYLGEGDDEAEASATMNRTITVGAKTTMDNGASYSDAASDFVTFTGSSYSFSSAFICTTSETLSNNSITCGYTAATTLTAPSKSGYVFEGWYNSSGVRQTTEASLPLRPTSNATYYAYYRRVYSIDNGATIVWDFGTRTPWSNVYLRRTAENNGNTHDALSRPGSSGYQWAKTYNSAVSDIRYYMFRDANGNTWNDYGQTTNMYNDISGITIYTNPNTTTYQDSKNKLDWQIATNCHKGSSGRTIYFDDSNTGWGSGNMYFNYGVDYDGNSSGFHRKIDFAATKVPGTANLWKLKASVAEGTNQGKTDASGQFAHDIYFQKWYVSKSYGYTNHNPITDTHVLERTAIYTDDITTNDFTLIPTSGSGAGTDGNPKIWTTTKLTGHTRRVTIGSHDHGTITVSYTDESNTAQAKTVTTDVAHTCIITVTVTPDDGYDYVANSLEVAGAEFTPGNTYTVRGDISISASFTPHHYNIKFDNNEDQYTGSATGTTDGIDDVEYDEGVSLTSNGFSLDHYTFAGWATSPTGSVVYTDGQSVSNLTTEDGETVTLYAIWDEITHTVSFANDGHGTTSPNSNQSVGEVTGVSISASNSTGYTFDTWTITSGDGTFASAATTASNTFYPEGDATLTASFTANTYTSTDNIEGGDGSDGTYTATYDATTIAINTAPALSGYDIEGYYTESTLNNKIATPNNDGTATLTKDFVRAETRYTDTDGKWVYPGAPTLYAKWVAKSYTITLNQQGGSDGSPYFTVTMNSNNYKYGDGKADEMTKPTKTGYTFRGYYTAVDGGGTQIFQINGSNKCVPILDVSDYTAANGNWINTDDDLVLYAYWTPNEYTVTLHSRYGTGAPSSVTATYDSNSLSGTPVSTKWGNTFGGWWTNPSGTGTEVISSAGALKTSVTGYTDGSGNWIHDGAVDLYAKWTPKEHLYWISGDGAGYSSGTEFTSAGDNKYYVKVDLEATNKFHLGDGSAAGGPSSNTTFTLETSAQNIGANANYFEYKTGEKKQTFVFVLDIYTLQLSIENFVIYKSASDQEYDTHKAYGSETGFDGTIYGDFELRIPVDALGKWSTLYLPFKPTKVQAWGGTAYHNLYPCHRPTSGVNEGKLMQGYYVIRTPYQAANMSLDRFGEWNDPDDHMEGGNLWTPAANTPYIIQWQNSWFIGRYISFWGNTETIEDEDDFVFGTAPEADGVINVLGNGTMETINVAGAYVLANDYGDGAWLRDEDVKKTSAVGPFECYILANAKTTGSHLVIKRRTGEETPTGWEDVMNSERKAQVVVYTITGLRVTEYNDCSFDEAGRRLSETYNEGIFIMRAGDESVKLMLR